MADLPNVVNADELEWQELNFSEHYHVLWKSLTPSMKREDGHIGVSIKRLPPGGISCPFHFHVREDEFFYVLEGPVTLRYGEDRVVLESGAGVSLPRNARIAHQFYNHTDHDVLLFAVGENSPTEVCHYPDTGKWLVRDIGGVGHFEKVEYFEGEPDPPLITQSGAEPSEAR